MIERSLGDDVLVPGQVSLWDITSGIAQATLAVYNFITTGGYVPIGSGGIACDDEAKGKLTLTVTKNGPYGNNVQLYIAGAPVDATDIPLNVYNADGTIPYLEHNGPTQPGSFHFRLTFTFANMVKRVSDEWDENWS